MAKAMRCDICQKFYDPYNTSHNVVKPNHIKLCQEYEDGDLDEDILDCCPTCMKSIEKYIESLKGDKIK